MRDNDNQPVRIFVTCEGLWQLDPSQVRDLDTVLIDYLAALWPSRPLRPGTGTLSHLLLHRLRQTLRALAQGIERAPLRVDGAVGVALAETALRLAGTMELVKPQDGQ
jgi:hypothetical protein